MPDDKKPDLSALDDAGLDSVLHEYQRQEDAIREEKRAVRAEIDRRNTARSLRAKLGSLSDAERAALKSGHAFAEPLSAGTKAPE
jgi:vacuolar-type H+-ATPase subunit C/Vma6